MYISNTYLISERLPTTPFDWNLWNKYFVNIRHQILVLLYRCRRACLCLCLIVSCASGAQKVKRQHEKPPKEWKPSVCVKHVMFTCVSKRKEIVFMNFTKGLKLTLYTNANEPEQFNIFLLLTYLWNLKSNLASPLVALMALGAFHGTKRKYLKRQGLQSLDKANVPKLTDAHVKARLRFVYLHVNQNLESWKDWNVVTPSLWLTFVRKKGLTDLSALQTVHIWTPLDTCGAGSIPSWEELKTELTESLGTPIGECKFDWMNYEGSEVVIQNYKKNSFLISTQVFWILGEQTSSWYPSHEQSAYSRRGLKFHHCLRFQTCCWPLLWQFPKSIGFWSISNYFINLD